MSVGWENASPTNSLGAVCPGCGEPVYVHERSARCDACARPWLPGQQRTCFEDDDGPEMRPSWEILGNPFTPDGAHPAYLTSADGSHDRYDEESFP